MTIRYISVCSGIEAATQAWAPLGWSPVAFYEICPFCSELLRHYYPGIPNGGDFTKADWSRLNDVDVVVAGTPCQDFSVAGRRAGAAGERGGLTIALGRKLNELEKFEVVLWENVPGVLSDRGNAFGYFLAVLAGEVSPLEPPGGRWTDAGYVRGPQRSIAWRVLDAQYFGLAQRRRRLFLAGCSGGGADPRKILFESEGGRRDFAPGRQTGPESAAAFAGRSGGDSEPVNDLAHTLRGAGFDGSEDGTGRANLIIFSQNQNGNLRLSETAGTLTSTSQERVSARNTVLMAGRTGVRRLTPRECERLQGFPDDYTLIPWRGRAAEKCPDGLRYQAIGNSMAVPVLRWLGERIARELEPVKAGRAKEAA